MHDLNSKKVEFSKKEEKANIGNFAETITRIA